MYKIYLVLICILFLNTVNAQTVVAPGFQDSGEVGSAINISFPSIRKIDGDEFFEDAERREKQGDLNQALTLFGRAAFEYNSDKKYNRYGLALLKMSNVHLLLANYAEAEQVVLHAALKNYSRIGSMVGQMESYNQLGKIYFAANKLTQSLWFYSQQGILAKQIKNNSSYIDSVLGIALIKIKKKEYDLAIKDLNTAEMLANNAKIDQFNQQIRKSRSLIAENQDTKKQ